ncbi:SAM-dependent methyltransferase [Cellulosimicrobium marinum]|uniref:SAM-dependent methyltransferase n=1 Tax=Cellulosimicrobium marinum TaxID=1638992 RepID=UPI001E317D02|nr:class I SAM-dependent methyltransferase [Cellulosimicrobium marinum]MCB7135210.1 class I SAM-dependent methyltransferase [Cellulosimicrobium marinum]
MPDTLVRRVLFPGRHHLVTRFQVDYLRALRAGLVHDLDGHRVRCAPDVEVVWAVTSANHSGTRRNPLPGHRREALIENVAVREGLPGVVVPVPDVAPHPRFAALVVTSVATQTGRAPTPDDTVVACSTPAVVAAYQDLGFRVVGVELDVADGADAAPRPWDAVELLAAGDARWHDLAHPAVPEFYARYGLVEQVREIFADPVVSGDGDLTTTRDYRTYAAAFEEASARKWAQVAPHVRPGRVVDIGCATGGLLEHAAREPRLHESDLFGVDVARHLVAEAEHKKAQGVFANPNVWFVQANILARSVMPAASVDTTLTIALTHEVSSYGDGVRDVETFARRVHDHTRPGGVWVNSDVCGPAEPARAVVLTLRTDDGLGAQGDGPHGARTDLGSLAREDVAAYVGALSTDARMAQFAHDFPRSSGALFAPAALGGGRWRLTLREAMEFMTRKDYVDNWLSEAHERFCDLTGAGWATLLEDAGFVLEPGSGAWRNAWLVEHSFAPVAALHDAVTGEPVDWPDTHVLTVARRPELA